MSTESHIKKQVMRFLAAFYPAAVVRKRHGTVYSTGGDPDLQILHLGIHIECELKQPGCHPTALQESRLRKWAAAGARTAVVHSVEEMRACMEEWFPPRPPASLFPVCRACGKPEMNCDCDGPFFRWSL